MNGKNQGLLFRTEKKKQKKKIHPYFYLSPMHKFKNQPKLVKKHRNKKIKRKAITRVALRNL